MQADRVGVAASRRARASTSRLRRRTMRPRRSPDPWRHHPLERVWCSIRSGLLLRWTELRISRLSALLIVPVLLAMNSFVLDRGYANFLELRHGEVRRMHLPRT